MRLRDVRFFFLAVFADWDDRAVDLVRVFREPDFLTVLTDFETAARFRDMIRVPEESLWLRQPNRPANG